MSEDLAGLGDRTHHTEIELPNREYLQRPPCVERWLRNKAPSTRKKYLSYLVRFQLLTGFSPEQFLTWTKSVESVEVQDLIDKTSMEFKPAIQFCYRVAIRSFLRHNGYNDLPKTRLEYVSQAWHRGYRREEIQRLLACLRQKLHKLFVVMAAESSLRSHVLMQLSYSHIKEDFENGTIPLAIRLEPRFYVGKKAAGYTFLGETSVGLLRECINTGTLRAEPEQRLVPRSYYGVWASIHRAKMKIGLDSKIQTCHGFRKYFKNALDEASVDHEKKMLIEGHFAGTRAKHYTERDFEQLRDIYRRAYQFIKLAFNVPTPLRIETEAHDRRVVDFGNIMERQRVLETKLEALEYKLGQMRAG